MQERIRRRCLELAEYVVLNEATMRKAESVFKVPKSTIHKDLTSRLYEIDVSLALKVKKVIQFNKAERHIRGGLATKTKYKG